MRKTYLSDDSDEEECKDTHQKVKILILGDKKVGKSSFIQRITKGYFTLFYTPTKNIEIHRQVKIGNMLVSCWEVPSHIKYHFKLQTLEADVVLLMFDTTRPYTKQHVTDSWKTMYKQLKTLPYIFVVGVRNPEAPEPEAPEPEAPEALGANGIYYIDNMSTDGYNHLLYNIYQLVA